MNEQLYAQRLLFVILAFLLALGFASGLPHLLDVMTLYIDGRKIYVAEPSLAVEATSFQVAAFLLLPLVGILDVVGVDLETYGRYLDYDLYLANTAFGVISFFLIGAVMLAYAIPRSRGRDAAAVLALLVLLAPFVFVVSKEIVPLAIAATLLVLARAGNWPAKTVAVQFAITLIVLAQYFRAYYLATAVLILASALFCRQRRSLLLGLYVVFFAYLFVGYSTLPLDDIRIGRAEYLEDVSASRIIYPLDDNSPAGFAMNRLYSFGTMLVPVVLPLRNLLYTPFFLLQLVISYKMVRVLWQGRDDFAVLAAHVVLAFTAVSALFEPDYGSYFRHKVGTIPFLLVMLVISLRRPDPGPDDEPPPDRDPDGGPARATGGRQRGRQDPLQLSSPARGNRARGRHHQ